MRVTGLPHLYYTLHAHIHTLYAFQVGSPRDSFPACATPYLHDLRIYEPQTGTHGPCSCGLWFCAVSTALKEELIAYPEMLRSSYGVRKYSIVSM
ncbi:unnamed protein product [Penicillium roqueforti FM164]|uniref:Genomic scaffold, ProqFM164S03 n=1 Tax=Penicillium roqueforti (strain FM164) TaxID=1365484 RepID=W6QY05_PENRF|nr:unnamed protein product [Penicillium roqueforti FM164]